MEDSAIREGFANLKPSKEYDALYEAALSRERADWIVGINATRLFSVLYGQTLNVGRVMTLTLGMAVLSSDRLEEVTLINDSSYLHLKEDDSSFQYALFDKKSRDKVCDGQFDWTELEDSPIGNPLAATRHYAFSDIGIEAEKVSRVSLDILESFMDKQMAWKIGKDHYLISQTCDDGWDYTLYDKNFKEIDGGQLDMPELSMQEAERAEMVEAQQHKEIYAEREANLLAEDLDEFSYSFDPYEYFDSVKERMEAVQSLKNHILSGDLKNIKDLLQTAIDKARV